MDYLSRICEVIKQEPPNGKVLYENGGQTGDMNLDGYAKMGKKRDLTLAAVLVPIVTHAERPTILLTQRAAHLQQHSGQVAFPGGKVETHDASPTAAALRETQEEVGLNPDYVQVRGYLDTYETGTGFRILPVVGFVQPGFSLAINKNEVADVFEVPLSLLMAHQKYKMNKIEWQGEQRIYYSMRYDGYNIWGATAGMLRRMAQRIDINNGENI
ncbi:MAG: CoA pyrophosphatase [Parvibaculales bacterium]